MRKLTVLDICGGVGGAAEGYQRAGFEVTCVDIEPQPDNPFVCHQRDLLSLKPGELQRYDLVHISPPCQRDAAITRGTNQHLRHTYPDLYGPARRLAEASGVPYVIENPAARPDVVLCGEMFGLQVIRHRKFELGGWTTDKPGHMAHRGRVAGMRHGVWYEGPYFAVYGNGGGKGTVVQWQDAMGIHWTNNRKSIAEAIPPAYTEWIGKQFTEWSKRNGR